AMPDSRVVRSEVLGARELMWNAAERTAVAIDALDNARLVRVEARSSVTHARDTFGKETVFEYDESTGLCVSRTDRLGGRTELLYDADGHLSGKTRARRNPHIISQRTGAARVHRH